MGAAEAHDGGESLRRDAERLEIASEGAGAHPDPPCESTDDHIAAGLLDGRSAPPRPPVRLGVTGVKCT